MLYLGREARRHFGCDTLEGGELEDQGGEGTKGSHWEKRVFENEAMTGVLTQNPVFSRVTLALMEDTGWYHVNYRMAEALQYGFGKGCDFAEYSCKKFMQIKKKAEESVSPYCDKMDDKLTCTLDWKAIAMCNLHKSTAIIDPKYQPFTSLDGVDSANVPYYGGDVEEADYCPFVRTTTHVTATGKVGSTQCAISENQVPDDTNYLRELYSSDSVCLRHKEKWTLQRPGALTKQLPSRFGGGCYKTLVFDIEVPAPLLRVSLSLGHTHS
ncbi:Leishmanolysin-like peptidase [Lamellibrachia satsuma]|nr:Leishmanolysin-like peptidase [Lamellibrachia satsuma]